MIYRGTLTGTVFVIHTDIWHTAFCVFRGRSQAVKTKYLPATASVKVAKTYPSATHAYCEYSFISEYLHMTYFSSVSTKTSCFLTTDPLFRACYEGV